VARAADKEPHSTTTTAITPMVRPLRFVQPELRIVFNLSRGAVNTITVQRISVNPDHFDARLGPAGDGP
jgi:hypothetical protein